MAYKDREKYLAAQRRYNEAHREERRILTRKWRERNKGKKQEYSKEYAKMYAREYSRRPFISQKISCRRKSRYYVEIGKIIKKNCTVCDSPNSQIHHQDYTKPLEVIWLCKKHHTELHYPPQAKL